MTVQVGATTVATKVCRATVVGGAPESGSVGGADSTVVVLDDAGVTVAVVVGAGVVEVVETVAVVVGASVVVELASVMAGAEVDDASTVVVVGSTVVGVVVVGVVVVVSSEVGGGAGGSSASPALGAASTVSAEEYGKGRAPNPGPCATTVCRPHGPHTLRDASVHDRADVRAAAIPPNQRGDPRPNAASVPVRVPAWSCGTTIRRCTTSGHGGAGG